MPNNSEIIATITLYYLMLSYSFTFEPNFHLITVTLSVRMFNVVTWYNYTNAHIQCPVWIETR